MSFESTVSLTDSRTGGVLSSGHRGHKYILRNWPTRQCEKDSLPVRIATGTVAHLELTARSNHPSTRTRIALLLIL